MDKSKSQYPTHQPGNSGLRKWWFLILLMCPYVNTVGAQTDYADLANWYYHPEKLVNFIGDYNLDIAVIDENAELDSVINIENNSEVNTGVDVFWLHPTQVTNPPTYPVSIPLEDQPYALISATILAQGALLSKFGRFYAPRYQQASPASFLDESYSDSERAAALISTYEDVKAAFEHYLETQNNGNKIILAGHSQGAFLLGMLLRDLFDSNPELRSKLITAALGGMGFYHAEYGTYVGGQWQNIPLCTAQDQCECIHTWRSFKESQDLPDFGTTLPIFNPDLVESDLVYRNVNLETDWFVQDSVYYNSESSPLRYYIAPNANYNLGGDVNFIAFDGLYTARFKRTADTKIALSIDYNIDPDDQRPNDLLETENAAGFPVLGYHNKDYHIYLWALLDQIDAKLAGCSSPVGLGEKSKLKVGFQIYPNPTNGEFSIIFESDKAPSAEIVIYDITGRHMSAYQAAPQVDVQIAVPGVYFVATEYGSKKIVIQ